MISLLTTFCITLAASLLLTPLVRAVADRLGVVDYPDGKRKLHKTLVPLWGGAAVYLSVVVGLWVARYGTFATGPQLEHLAALLTMAAGLVCFFGGIDDCRHLNPRLKLLLQIGAVIPVVLCGCTVHRVVAFGYPIELGWFGGPLTVFWLVGCINALNLLDGMDGLACLVGLSTATMMAIIGVHEGHAHVAVIALVLGGALAGFLAYNLPPATIFLGDSGSMVIGLIVGVLGIEGSLKTSATLAITAPAMVMALPILDSLLAVIRRKLTGRPFDAADRQHIHHRLLDRGLTPWQVLCVVTALCLMTGAAATFASIFRNDALAWVVAITLLVLVVRLRLFAHYEFSLLKRAVAHGLAAAASHLFTSHPGRNVPTPADLAALPLDEVWLLLIEEIRPWSVSRLELNLSRIDAGPCRRRWSDPAGAAEDDVCWSVAITYRKRDGRFCELRAHVPDTTAPEFLYLTGLTGVLKSFGSRLAEEIEPVPQLSLLLEAEEGACWEHQFRRAA
jgi:UDP-GlcNAc:undecaprenyl-phosphate GlcNAc-1-phosphate transferase